MKSSFRFVESSARQHEMCRLHLIYRPRTPGAQKLLKATPATHGIPDSPWHVDWQPLPAHLLQPMRQPILFMTNSRNQGAVSDIYARSAPLNIYLILSAATQNKLTSS